jgi:hypothetical protein
MVHLIFSLIAAITLSSPALAGQHLSVASVGDIMMGTDHPEDLLPPEGGRGIFNGVASHLAGSDIVFGNLEGPLMDGGTPQKCRKDSDTCYEFRTPASFALLLKEAGFNAIGIANNHAHDFGNEGVESTIKALASAGIMAVGGRERARFVVKGKRVAVLGFSYSPSLYSHSIYDIPEAIEIVREAEKCSDLVIVSFHGGAEGSGARHITGEEEEYLGENRGNVTGFARSVVDAGADLVIGHGPHVLRAMELYRGRLIAYSVGNFLGYERFNISGPSGISVILRASMDVETGEFIEGELIPIIIMGKGLPEVDPAAAGIKLVRELTLEDIPSPGLKITDHGGLYPEEKILKEDPEAAPVGLENSTLR